MSKFFLRWLRLSSPRERRRRRLPSAIGLRFDGGEDKAIAIPLRTGKIAGASIIITGAVTGSGDLRRLRALDTQTAQVLTVASERY